MVKSIPLVLNRRQLIIENNIVKAIFEILKIAIFFVLKLQEIYLGISIFIEYKLLLINNILKA